MRTNTSLDSCTRSATLRSRAVRTLMALGAVLFLANTASAQFTIAPLPLPLPQPLPGTPPACGPEVKEEVVKALAAVENLADDAQEAVEKEVYAKYQYCAQDAVTFAAPTSFLAAARECGAAVSNMGSIFFEEMSCAGYDPQRRLFAAPIKIKQVFGFGPAPFPGSREHVLHCVADANGVLVPVARNSVHLANSVSGPPTWQFAVIAGATWNLQTVLPLNGATRRARSILSWQLTPTDCNYQPIWGNALNYRIRLDP